MAGGEGLVEAEIIIFSQYISFDQGPLLAVLCATELLVLSVCYREN